MADPEADDLVRLAEELGVETTYWDVGGQRHQADVDQLRAVIGVLVGARGATGTTLDAAVAEHRAGRQERVCAPTLVRWDDQPLSVVLSLAVDVTAVELTLRDEDGTARVAPMRVELRHQAVNRSRTGGRQQWEVPLGPLLDGLGVGRHHLEVQWGDERATAVVLAAPSRVARLDPHDRLWGLFTPLYALWTPARPQAVLGHLERLAEWLDGLGGKVVGTLPLLAGTWDEPCDPSPYSPLTRRWWNEAYLDVAARPEIRNCPEAMALVDATSASSVDPTEPFDARTQARQTRAVLEALVTHELAPGGRLRQDVDRFAADHPDLGRYARFRAVLDRRRCSWHTWEADDVAAVTDNDEGALLHRYAQWAMIRQLTGLDRQLSARDQRLYLDLPVGVNGDGYDTWAEPELFAWGMAAGAPPDEFFTAGQNWGFPPLLPDASRADGHAHLATCLRAHMAVCGLLRLDHVMAFHRLYWVPDGEPADRGVYVRTHSDELFAVLSIESHRAGCPVVGEDLGTVPDEVRHRIERHGIYSMYVAQFCQDAAPGAPLVLPQPGTMASVNTHDTPTLAGWVTGDDIDRRHHMGLLDEQEAADEQSRRNQQVRNLATSLGLDRHDDHQVLLVALLEALGRTDAAVVLASLDDLLGRVEPQNVPGTPVDRPNWVLRSDASLGALESDGALADALGRLQAARLGAWANSLGTLG
ncbi:MAG: 4-alpha-glucanotransferase [Acidimicrobiia bacterium]|nr:4-alpha-glucanotransferase [Acidimicrobiia bacterium]